MQLKTYTKADLKGDLLLRVDFNLSVPNSQHPRVQSILGLLHVLLSCDQVRKIIIISHRGRPVGIEKKYSLALFVEILQSALLREVGFIKGELPTPAQIASQSSRIILLENLRYHPGECSSDPIFANSLAQLADMLIVDAFGVSHRQDTSMTLLPQVMAPNAFAGAGMVRETALLTKCLKEPRPPFVVILGGNKSQEKLLMARHLVTSADTICLAGQLGIPNQELEGLEAACGESGTILIKPVDYRYEDGAICDIGDRSLEHIKEAVRGAQTVFWNGPLGKFENPQIAPSTICLAQRLSYEWATRSNQGFVSIIGGGETASAFDRYHATLISTGGGAVLAFLKSGYNLPGLLPFHQP